jgi:hypothetical protein
VPVRLENVMAPNGAGLSPPSTPFGTPPSMRRAGLRSLALRFSFAAAVGMLAFASSAVAAPSASPDEHPNLASIANGPLAIHDTALRSSTEICPSGAVSWSGGTYTTNTNEQVTIYASSSYPVDQAFNQRWANFFASLVHGSELSQVTVCLAMPGEVSAICRGGEGVLGCYGNNTIIGPGEDSPIIAAEAVLTHEYGHHVAAHRTNAPWAAISWGTKRWASYLQVCARARRHELFPGAETALEYEFNPGEVFAEDFRVLNEEGLGLTVTPWQVVDPSLQPNQKALTLLQQDVLNPWEANRQSQISGRFTVGGSSVRTYRVANSLDGTLAVSVSGSPHVRVQLLSGTRVVARGGSSTQATICGGSRRFTVRVTRTSGSGPFSLTLLRP